MDNGAYAPTSDRARLLSAHDGADCHPRNDDRLEAGIPSQQSDRYPLYPSSAGYPAAVSGQDAQRLAPEAQNFARPTYVVGMNTTAGVDYGAPFTQVPVQHFDQPQQHQFVYGQVDG